MKKINANHKFFLGLLMMVGLVLFSCEDDDHSFGNATAPSNLTLDATIAGVSAEMANGDGSGKVRFQTTADQAISYKYDFGDNTSAISSTDTITHQFTKPGTHDYLVTVTANGTGGVQSSITKEVSVYSSFKDPETKALLTGGSSKTWYVAAALPGHLGVGPIATATPDYYSAAPFEKKSVGCFYDDAMTFSLDGGNIVYQQDNKGATFYNADYTGTGQDQCMDLDTAGKKNVSLGPANSGVPSDKTTGTAMNFSDGGFMSYYIGTSKYEILNISENSMEVRAIPGSNPALVWYLKFTTDPNGGAGEDTGGKELESEFNDLVWEDDFDGTSLDTANWNYEIGNGGDGWGNNELQYYTDKNTSINDGILSITAKAESSNGYDYTSSRITTQDKHEYKYGRVEVRAKLPEGKGTWPAIWMLGADFEQNPWPACGEIDIMEEVGRDPNNILSTLHLPGNSGANGISNNTTISTSMSEFHNYTVEWTADHIVFAVDKKIFHEFTNDSSTPFNHNFFIILNVAMGGNLGGDVDPNFDKSAMQIDYVKVYQ